MPSRKKSDITIDDVAKLVGVSTATVSRVLSGSPLISDATRDKVLEAVRLLDYRPNALASALRKQRSLVVGVLMSDHANPFFVHVVQAVEKRLADAGYSVILCYTRESAALEERQIQLLLQRRVDGLIISVAHEQGRHLDILRRSHIPRVFINRVPVDVPGPVITADNRGGVHLAVAHLVAHQHRRIGFLYGNLAYSTGRDRLAGFLDALAAHDLPRDEALIKAANFRAEDAAKATAELLTLPSPPTAIVASDVYATIGMLRTVQEAGIPVPDGMSLIGYDDHDWVALLTPPLTVIRQPTAEMGQLAAETLLAELQSEEKLPSNNTQLPCTLVERASVAAPNQVKRAPGKETE